MLRNVVRTTRMMGKNILSFIKPIQRNMTRIAPQKNAFHLSMNTKKSLLPCSSTAIFMGIKLNGLNTPVKAQDLTVINHTLSNLSEDEQKAYLKKFDRESLKLLIPELLKRAVNNRTVLIDFFSADELREAYSKYEKIDELCDVYSNHEKLLSTCDFSPEEQKLLFIKMEPWFFEGQSGLDIRFDWSAFPDNLIKVLKAEQFLYKNDPNPKSMQHGYGLHSLSRLIEEPDFDKLIGHLRAANLFSYIDKIYTRAESDFKKGREHGAKTGDYKTLMRLIIKMGETGCLTDSNVNSLLYLSPVSQSSKNTLQDLEYIITTYESTYRAFLDANGKKDDTIPAAEMQKVINKLIDRYYIDSIHDVAFSIQGKHWELKPKLEMSELWNHYKDPMELEKEIEKIAQPIPERFRMPDYREERIGVDSRMLKPL